MRIRVLVTAADILLGVKGSCGRCPVALAIGRALPGWDVAVFGDALILERDGRDPVARVMPVEVRRFVHDFDEGVPVRPFCFGFDLGGEAA